MNKAELACLPKGTTLYALVCGADDHSGSLIKLRYVQDGKLVPLVLELDKKEARSLPEFVHIDTLPGETCFSVAVPLWQEHRRHLYLVQQLSRWATGDPEHFVAEHLHW